MLENQHQAKATYRPAGRPRRRQDNEALKHVISLRVTDEELSYLTRESLATSKSISEIIRDALKTRPLETQAG